MATPPETRLQGTADECVRCAMRQVGGRNASTHLPLSGGVLVRRCISAGLPKTALAPAARHPSAELCEASTAAGLAWARPSAPEHPPRPRLN